MSQNDLVVANASRSTVRADINSALAALGTLQKGSSAPTGAAAGWLWLDDDTPSSTKWTLNQYDGTDWIPIAYIDTVANTWTPVTALSVAGARGHIAGWTSAPNVSNPLSRIDVAAGRAIDGTGAALLEGAALTKRYDAVWAAGNGNGGRSGSAADGDWWIHACLDVDDQLVDYFFSQSRTSPTLPSGYTLFLPIGWFRVASGNIVAFSTVELPGGGIRFTWTTATLDSNRTSTLGTTRILETVRVPTGIAVTALLTAFLNNNGNAWVRIGNPAEAATVPGYNVAPLGNLGANQFANGFGSFRVGTNTAAQVALQASGDYVDYFSMQTDGFEWARR